MSGSHNLWQLRWCGVPLMTTRHSKQIPMPHSAERGSPVTDVRHAFPAIIMATATVAPAGTVTLAPFTVSAIVLDMGNLFRGA